MSDVKEYRKLLRCNGLAELSVHLLGTTTHVYVMLENFTSEKNDFKN